MKPRAMALSYKKGALDTGIGINKYPIAMSRGQPFQQGPGKESLVASTSFTGMFYFVDTNQSDLSIST
ncbi:MAG TPA: hypothetical protein ENO00_00290 [Deltaproteobacteria bacterium]|jgi:hypothetical protein|nr:hypothetical protein [Deltaproteobacteria bacterium]